MAEGDASQPAKKAKLSHTERVPGILFTLGHPSKIQQGANVLLRLLDSFDAESGYDESNQDLSVSDAIANELAALEKTKRRFRFAAELSRGCGLISCPKKIIPSNVVYSLLTENCPAVPLQLISRVEPLDVVCAPNLVSFETVCVPYIRDKFRLLTTDTTWKVVFDKHGETNITRERVIELAHSVIPEQHEASVHEPQIVILVHIFQSICGVGLLRDYDQLSQYNIRKLVTSKIKASEN